ncbi:MAG: FliG C-terminal domain-containing protein [Elusimicrobiota bacterium]
MKNFVKFGLLIFCLPLLIRTIGNAEGSIDYSTIIAEKKKIEDDYKLRVQNILDRILGPEKAIVTNVSVELKLEQQVQNREAAQRKKKDQKPQLRREEKFLLPGVPIQKTPENISVPEEETAEKSSAVENKIIIPSLIWKLRVTVMIDDKTPEALIKKTEAIISGAIDLNIKRGDILKIEKVAFVSPWYSYVLKPYVGILSLLSLIIIIFLFGPLTSVLKSLANAIREGRGTEVSIQAKTEQNESINPAIGGGAGGSLGMGATGGQENAASEDREEKKKKHFSFITNENLKSLLYLIQEEAPENISLIVTYLSPEMSAEVISCLPPEVQMQVALCLVSVKLTSREDVTIIEEDIKKKIDFLVGGMESFLKILAQVDNRTRKEMLAALERQSPRLAKKALEQIFTFENMVNLSDQTIQTILREVKLEQLAIALRAANIETVKDKIMSNMSEGGKMMLKEEIEFGRPVTQEQIEEVQREIEKVVKQMELDKKIVLHPEEGKKRGVEIEGKLERLELRTNNQSNAEPVLTSQAKQIPFTVSSKTSVDFYQSGVQLYQAGKINEAIIQFQQSVKVDPSVWQTYQYLASCLWSQGRIDEAIQAYERVVTLNPNNLQLKDWLTAVKQKRKEQLQEKQIGG